MDRRARRDRVPNRSARIPPCHATALARSHLVTIHDVRTTRDAQRLEALDLIPAPRTPGSGASTLGGPGSDTQTPRRDDTQTTFKVLNFDLAAIRPDLACERILEFAREGRSREVHLCNSYTLTLARRDG